MTKPLLAAALAAALLIPLGAQAQAAPSAAVRAAPDIKNFEQQLAEAQTQMKRMQEQMDKLRQTQDPLNCCRTTTPPCRTQ